jgi:hypothetical protein
MLVCIAVWGRLMTTAKSPGRVIRKSEEVIIGRWHEPRLITVEDAYTAIANYARQRLIGIGGTWRQYKHDFFDIFFDAYWSGCCGAGASRKFDRACARLKRKQLCYRDFDVTGESIRDLLRSQPWWTKANKKDRDCLETGLAAYWDEWTFAWDRHPNPMPRRYQRRQGGRGAPPWREPPSSLE